MGINRVPVGPHGLAHLEGDVANLHRVGADDAELHREADRRSEIEPVDAHPRLRERTVRHGLLDPSLDALAGGDVLRHDHDLRERLVRKLRVETEPEARRALADIGGVGEDIGIVAQKLLGLLRRLGGDADGRALRQPHLEEEFGTLGEGEELLLHAPEGDDRTGEYRQGRDDGEASPVHAGLHDPAERPIEPGVVDRVRVGMRMRPSFFGRSFTPRYGVKITATNHDATRAIATTQKIPPAYSPTVELAKPTGRKPAAVTSVPVSMGKPWRSTRRLRPACGPNPARLSLPSFRRQ